MSAELLAIVVAILILLLLSAYFSASETAFSTANKKRLKALADKGNISARKAVKIAERYDLMLSSVLVGNNIVNIALASLSTLLFIKLFNSEELATTVSAVVITLLVLVFGEISPKYIAMSSPERIAMFSAHFLQILIWLLTPVCHLFSSWQRFLSRAFNIQSREKMSQEELLMVVDEFQQEGNINNNEVTLLRNAIEFSDRDAKDILTPRVKIAGVELDSTKEKIAEIFSETKFSRLIVYKDNIDNIIGVLHQKNFYDGTGISGKKLSQLISPTVFVATSEKISTVLKKLQQKQAQVAVVLDEFGGTYGIITMEDVLEELVGEIWDELDHVTQPFQKLADDTERVDGAVELVDFCEHFHVEIESEMISLSGWVMEHLHALPKCGDRFTYEHLQLTVLKVEQRCITLLEVKKLPAAAETPDI